VPTDSGAPAARARTIGPPRRFEVPVRELLERRELLGFLVWRDIKIRYRQTLIGIVWVILQPLCAMAIFTVIFQRLARLEPDGDFYFLFVYAGLAPWLYFSAALGQASNAMVDNERLLTKVYLPRLYMPLSPTLTGLLDLAVSTSLLIVMQLVFGTGGLSWRVLTLPLWAGLLWLWVAALGSMLSAINVQFRDVRYAMPFLIQLLLFVSPVVYSTSIIPAGWRPLYALNPLSTVIDGFRWSIVGAPSLQPVPVTVSVLTAVVTGLAALVVFHASERSFADVL